MKHNLIFRGSIILVLIVSFFISCDSNPAATTIEVDMTGDWTILSTPGSGDPDIGNLTFTLTYSGFAFGGERWYGVADVTGSDSIDGTYSIMGVETDGNYGFHISHDSLDSDGDGSVDQLNFMISTESGDILSGDYYGEQSGGPMDSDGTFTATK